MKATQAQTPCIQQTFEFQALGSRKVEVDFSGGYLSSDGGGLLLREIDQKRGFTQRLSEALGEVDYQQQTAELDGKKRKFKDLIFSQELDIRHYTELRYRTQKSWNPYRRR